MSLTSERKERIYNEAVRAISYLLEGIGSENKVFIEIKGTIYVHEQEGYKHTNFQVVQEP